MDTPGISVIICCYNSEKRIKDTLRSLFLQENLSEVSWEIIIVDNASQDHTRLIARSTEEEYNLKRIPFKIVEEERAGLSYAREKGIFESTYDFVLFCDDDNWLNKYYIINTYNFLTDNQSYGVVGGNGIPECETVPPKWFERYKGIYATGCRRDGDVTNVYGAGMGIRKELMRDYSSKLSDRKGESLISGGDSEICLHVRKKGLKIRQLCQNTFVHFIPKQRLELSYLYRMAKARGETKAQLKLIKDQNKKIGLGYRFKRDMYDFLQVIQKKNKIDLIYFYKHKLGFWSYILKN